VSARSLVLSFVVLGCGVLVSGELPHVDAGDPYPVNGGGWVRAIIAGCARLHGDEATFLDLPGDRPCHGSGLDHIQVLAFRNMNRPGMMVVFEHVPLRGLDDDIMTYLSDVPAIGASAASIGAPIASPTPEPPDLIVSPIVVFNGRWLRVVLAACDRLASEHGPHCDDIRIDGFQVMVRSDEPTYRVQFSESGGGHTFDIALSMDDFAPRALPAPEPHYLHP
jgi:hypothetical protein